MIDCDKVQEYISDYIEKRMTPGLQVELESHFQQCNECNTILQRIPQIQDLIKNMPTVKCSEDFNLKLRERIAANPGDSLFSNESFKKVSYGFSFAVFIFVIIFGFNFFNQTESDSDVALPKVQSQENILPSNTNIKQTSSTNLTGTGELDVRTKDGEGVVNDSSKTDDIKNTKIKYVDTK
jgi:hypothetical protein